MDFFLFYKVHIYVVGCQLSTGGRHMAIYMPNGFIILGLFCGIIAGRQEG